MMLPGLAMSRSIGDDIAASVGVHATPEVTAVPLLPKHKFMIVASDGVWEFLTSEDAVAIVVQCNGNAEKAAAELCARSFRLAIDYEVASVSKISVPKVHGR